MVSDLCTPLYVFAAAAKVKALLIIHTNTSDPQRGQTDRDPFERIHPFKEWFYTIFHTWEKLEAMLCWHGCSSVSHVTRLMQLASVCCMGWSTTAGRCIRGWTVIWWLNILWPPPIHSWKYPVGGSPCNAVRCWVGEQRETCSSLPCTESRAIHPPWNAALERTLCLLGWGYLPPYPL